MHMMLLMAEYQSTPLEEAHDLVWLRVHHMCPFMNLVREDAQDHSEYN